MYEGENQDLKKHNNWKKTISLIHITKFLVSAGIRQGFTGSSKRNRA